MSRYLVVRLISSIDGEARVDGVERGFETRENAMEYATRKEDNDFSFYYDVVDTEERESWPS